MKRLIVTVGVIALASVSPAIAAPGDMDPGFSGDGFALAPFGENERRFGPVSDLEAGQIALQPDGKLLVAADVFYSPGCSFGCSAPHPGPSLARFTADGALDPSFGGGDGQVEPRPRDLPGLGPTESLVVQPDGKILIAASKFDELAVLRLNSDGAPDRSFGGGDAVSTIDVLSQDRTRAVALQPDGRILIAGYSETAADGPGAAIARLLPSGEPDPSFSGDGRRFEPIDSHDGFTELALRADGRILALGASDFKPLLAQYTPGGELDASFSSDGLSKIDDARVSVPTSMQIDGEDRVVVLTQSSSSSSALLRFGVDGELDPSFGLGGIVNLPEPAIDNDLVPPSISQVGLDAQSRPIIAGTGGRALAIGRLTVEGTMDTGFSDQGWAFRYLRDGYLEGYNGATTGAADVAVTPEAIVVAARGFGPGSRHRQLLVARQSLNQGPADADADGILDHDEACPWVFGDCPVIKGRPLLWAAGRGQRALAATAGGVPECGLARQIQILRLRPGPDRVLVEAEPSRGRVWYRPDSLRGVFYARTTHKKLLPFGICPRGRSKLVRPTAPPFGGSKVSGEAGGSIAINAHRADNRITVAFDRSRHRVIVSDAAGVVVDPQRGDRSQCRRVSRTEVLCRRTHRGGLGAFLRSGNDVLIVDRSYRDIVVGAAGAGADTVAVSDSHPAALRFEGEGGDDRIKGGAGFDRISGGPGNDRLQGGSGADSIGGEDGRDSMAAGTGKDVLGAEDQRRDRLINCGGGRDRVSVDRRLDPRPTRCEVTD